MKIKLLTAIVASGVVLAGCKTMESADVGGLLDSGSTAMKAMTLTDDDVVTLSNDSCAAMDAQNKVADAKSKYTLRLNKVIAGMPQAVNGKKAVYKVYMTQDMNAWAMANGCIRVYSGLMDLMNDDELRGVIGHEILYIGHDRVTNQGINQMIDFQITIPGKSMLLPEEVTIFIRVAVQIF